MPIRQTLPFLAFFFDKNVLYDYALYTRHIVSTTAFAEQHPNFYVHPTHTAAFRNLQICLREGQWAMVSKGRAPVIHFVIRHPKLVNAIENMIVPVTEEGYVLE